MVHCLDVASWQAATPKELRVFYTRRLHKKNSTAEFLTVRSRLKQADMYAYLRARFGAPNGIQNLLRSDSSDNLVHWDFNLKAGDADVYIQGRARDVVIIVYEHMTDEDWKALILAIKADFVRLGREKSQMLKSFEKFVVFQNKFVSLARLCAELHGSITDAPPPIRILPRLTSKKSFRRVKAVMHKIDKRSRKLHGDCLKLQLLTPIMAEAFLNMMILTFCKPEVRNDLSRYEAFVREKIPQKLEQLPANCIGFTRVIDPSNDNYKNFLRVMNARNFNIHGNIDPVREQIETVYFEGKCPIFAASGDHLLKVFDHLEDLYPPQKVVKDYEDVHLFLIELWNMLAPSYGEFFSQVINDPFPGFELRKKGVTKILPSYNAVMSFPDERSDEDLKVTW